jgi:hypothetical protein
MSGDREFSVYQFFPDESSERVLSLVDAETAVKMAAQLYLGVGCRIGTTQRVIITDGGDYTVFEWKHGKGVTYPTAEMRRQQ